MALVYLLILKIMERGLFTLQPDWIFLKGFDPFGFGSFLWILSSEASGILLSSDNVTKKNSKEGENSTENGEPDQKKKGAESKEPKRRLFKVYQEIKEELQQPMGQLKELREQLRKLNQQLRDLKSS